MWRYVDYWISYRLLESLLLSKYSPRVVTTHDLCLQWFEFNHHALGSTCSNLFNMLLLFTVEAACVSLTILEVTNSYEVDARHGSWPSSGFSRVLHKDEINGGHQYTMAVKMMNVIGSGGVNESGHPGGTLSTKPTLILISSSWLPLVLTV